METSILNSTKKVLGIGPDDTSFDLDIITFINSAFSILQQLGVGPVDGFEIEDDTAVWSDFVDKQNASYVSLVKTCVYLRVRMLFDPPTTSYLQDTMQRQIEQHEWRLNVLREGDDWVDPMPPLVINGE